ncbi:hypothetical protein [Hydrogenophaga sp. OTU3427]|uniref:hypothetical protein n=1 Tax=Hydrogenophaga sp. OTU3427 TaxID=3043856 RepID=UPI00313B6C8C
MRRRGLLTLGLGAAVGLALVGGGLALQQPVLVAGRLAAPARGLFVAVGRAVLAGSLPTEPAAQAQALLAWLGRLDDSIAALPPHTQAELGQLLAVLVSAPGRWTLAGLRTDWPQASVAEVQAALEAMRHSRLALRQQAYFALRDLSAAAYFAAPETWFALGYPGPMDL